MKNSIWKIKITSEQGFGKIIHLPKGEYIFGSDEEESFFVLPGLAPTQFKVCVHNLDSFDVYDFITQSDAKVEQVGKPENDLFKIDYDEFSFLITKINNEFHYINEQPEEIDIPELNIDDEYIEDGNRNMEISDSNSLFSPATAILIFFIVVLGLFMGYSININMQNSADEEEAYLSNTSQNSINDDQRAVKKTKPYDEKGLDTSDVVTDKIVNNNSEKELEKNTKYADGSHLDYLKMLIATNGLKDINASFEKGEYVIKGYVASTRDFSRLAKTISSEGIAVNFKIHITEQIIASAQNILSQYGYGNIKVLPSEKLGHIIFDGYIKNPYQWLEVERRLKSDIDGLTSWEKIKPVLWGDIEQLIVMLKKENLYDKITINKNGRNLIITGPLNDIEKKKIAEVLIKSGLNESLEISTSSIPTDYPSLGKILNAHVSSFVTGKKEYFSLGNNKYFVGSILPNGARIIQIKKDCVLLFHENDLLCADPRKG